MASTDDNKEEAANAAATTTEEAVKSTDDQPVAVDDDAKEEQKGDDEKKDQMPEFKRIPKPFPGEHWKDQYPDKKDPRGEPTFIEFKWNKDFKKMEDCDTIHMLYLLQHACELHRRRVIERNKYFTSISRADRYISHVDTPQIISNFIEWHNKDKEGNVFTGKMMKTKKKLFMINEMISEVGDTKKGPATRIFTKLRKEVMIEHDSWTETGNTKLKLFTWGMTKMYGDEVVLEECTVEQIVTLFTFVNEDEQKDDADKPAEETVNGVLAYFEGTDSKAGKNLMAIAEWKEKIVEWIQEEKVDGKMLKEKNNKEMNKTMRAKLESDEKKAKKLNGPCGKMLNFCKKMPVHKVLEAAKAKAAAKEAAE